MTNSLYNGAVQIKFSEAAHRYSINGSYKEGVTSIIRVLAKDGLLQWYANMVVNYIEANGLRQQGGWFVTKEDLRTAKYAALRYKDEAAEVGKQVHKWIENHIAGEDTEVSVQMRPSVEAFLKWEARAKPEYLQSERVVFSRRLDYCGTTDAVVLLDGKKTILDFKTGKPDEEWSTKLKRPTGLKRARTEHFLQDAFYDLAIEEEDGEPAAQYAVLYINSSVHEFRTPHTWLFRELAESVLQTHRLLKTANYKNAYREV